MQVSGGTLTSEPSIDLSDVNRLKNEMVGHSKKLLMEMEKTKIQLRNICIAYKIMMEDKHQKIINNAID
jgi:hypothetical protein